MFVGEEIRASFMQSWNLVLPKVLTSRDVEILVFWSPKIAHRIFYHCLRRLILSWMTLWRIILTAFLRISSKGVSDHCSSLASSRLMACLHLVSRTWAVLRHLAHCFRWEWQVWSVRPKWADVKCRAGGSGLGHDPSAGTLLKNRIALVGEFISPLTRWRAVSPGQWWLHHSTSS